MRLVHFSREPLTEVHAVEQKDMPRDGFAPKPRGLWVSDEDAEQSWSSWCADEMADWMVGTTAYGITLAKDARLLVIGDSQGIDDFHRLYSEPGIGRSYFVDWPAVAARFQGIIITPYVWERRLSEVSWYYPWDCASGCIWDTAAIAGVEQVKP